jgi:PIN domain nuclease of toxin-antitoxin system
MKLLLDTHIWLWSQGASAKLAPRVTRELENPANELWLSPISLWELVLLHAKGSVALDAEIEKCVPKALRAHTLRNS